jgi:hypothetical protein
MKNLQRNIEVSTNEIAKDVALELVKILVNRTPVDTSTALSNWQVGINRPVGSTIPPHFPGIGGSSAGSSRAATIAKATAMIASKKPGQPIYVSNLLDYIEDLNDGTSRQAPKGFVEMAIDAAKQRVAKAKLKI